MRDLTGKTYWLIGASEGVGRSLARKLSAVGVRLILSARNEDRLVALAASLPGPTRVLPLDVRSADAVRQAGQMLGHVDGVAYISGVMHQMHAQEWNTDQLREMMDVNLGGVISVLGEVLPRMMDRDAGHVLLMGSVAAYRGMPGFLGYGASKAGLYSLAESLRADLGDSGVEIQIVHPSFIRTRMTAPVKTPMPMILEPEDAARRIFDHMQTDRFATCFPQPTGFAVQMLQIIPDWLYFAAVGRKK